MAEEFHLKDTSLMSKATRNIWNSDSAKYLIKGVKNCDFKEALEIKYPKATILNDRKVQVLGKVMP